MREFIPALQKSTFFQGKSGDEILRLLEGIRFSIRSFGGDEIIVSQGDKANHLGIILSGMVEVQKVFPAGDAVTMAHLSVGQTIGEAVLFSRKQSYPASIIPASSSCTVLFVSRSELVRLFQQDENILVHFVENMSNRVVMLAERIEILSLPTIRQKILYFLVKEAERQGSLAVTLASSKRRLSEHLGIPRPSLSRELQRMKEEGSIDYDRTTITILRPDLLEPLDSYLP